MPFPKDFIWGSATSSYQIEGAWEEGGKGPSIWDDLVHDREGFIKDGGTGDAACDHVHRFREDVALMAELGVRAYRFSISWPRVLPEGTGRVNPEGVRFYSALVDCLLSRGIRPVATLYHWDLPRALHERGGWLNPEMVFWFGGFARVMADALGDRVKDWITVNEPQCIVGLGYATAEHAPALVASHRDRVRMAHVLLKSHGEAVRVLRDRVPCARIGYAPCSNPVLPETERPEDVEAARSAYFAVSPDAAGFLWQPAWFSDPALLGRYPEDGLAVHGRFLPEGWEKDLPGIAEPLDFYAQNIYNSNAAARAAENAAGFELLPFPTGCPRTMMGWPVTPEALYWGPRFLYERYRTPILISENGMSCPDALSPDGRVHDPVRIDYIRAYLLQLRRAIDAGVDVRGYLYWSLLDNFEWKEGYTQRFGLVHVDYGTQKRTPKDSAFWYREVMRTNGESL